jgi:hypothetical protein
MPTYDQPTLVDRPEARTIRKAGSQEQHGSILAFFALVAFLAVDLRSTTQYRRSASDRGGVRTDGSDPDG